MASNSKTKLFEINRRTERKDQAGNKGMNIMTRTKIFISASTVAIGAALALGATPAAAQAVCDVAGVPSGTATGTPSFACGPGTQATGAFSVAVGRDSTATGDYSTAVGDGAYATGTDGTAVGDNSRATDYATSVGFGAGAGRGGLPDAGIASTSVGVDALASGYESVANGYYATASGDYSVAVGEYAVAGGANSIAIGRHSSATGDNSTVIGTGASDGGFANSVAIGAGSVNTADNQVSIGGGTAATARTLTGVAAGTISATSLDAVNGSQLNATNNRVTALEGSVGDLQDAVVVLDNNIHNVDERASSGTAVAIAMGGATFLPNTSFNLTGNVGYYRKSWAGALNLGALVSPNAALNAGVGFGLNHGGKVGARAGFTFGW